MTNNLIGRKTNEFWGGYLYKGVSDRVERYIYNWNGGDNTLLQKGKPQSLRPMVCLSTVLTQTFGIIPTRPWLLSKDPDLLAWPLMSFCNRINICNLLLLLLHCLVTFNKWKNKRFFKGNLLAQMWERISDLTSTEVWLEEQSHFL